MPLFKQINIDKGQRCIRGHKSDAFPKYFLLKILIESKWLNA